MDRAPLGELKLPLTEPFDYGGRKAGGVVLGRGWLGQAGAWKRPFGRMS